MKTPNYRDLIIAAGQLASGDDRETRHQTGYSQLLRLLRIAEADTTESPKDSEPTHCTHGMPLTYLCPKCLKEGPVYLTHAGAILIEFDGGTTCNVPSKGYGNGYGSFRVERGQIQKRQFGKMSANCAEIMTMTEAIKHVWGFGLKRPQVHIVGDSQIALKWAEVCAETRTAKMSKKSSPEFQDAIKALKATVSKYPIKITTEWHGRQNSVRIFGH